LLFHFVSSSDSNQVAKFVDEHGNKLYHTLQARTIVKHAQRMSEKPTYKPKSKGGKPSVVNNPDGEDFISFLREQFFIATRTGQNLKKFDDVNKFIVDMYKVRYFKNMDAEPPIIAPKTLRRLRGLMKAKGVRGFKYVSARRWEAMGDPRNYISWYVAANIGFKDVPLELRFNWDDTSLFVAGEERAAGGCVGIAFTADEVFKELELLNRSPGMQAPTHEKGRHCSPRMVQWGVLASGSGRLEACVCKIYDRSISEEDNLRLVHIKKLGDCDIYVLYIRGKQLAPGSDPSNAEAIAHGGVSDHASEAEVAELIFRDVVATKIEKRKAEVAVAMKRISQSRFGAKVGTPEYQRMVSLEMEAMRQAAVSSHGSFADDARAEDAAAMQLPAEGRFDGFASSDSESEAASCSSCAHGSPATPASAMHRAPSESCNSGVASEVSDDSDSCSNSCDSSTCASFATGKRLGRRANENAAKRARTQTQTHPGMGSASACAHLPSTLNVQQHIHPIFKEEQSSEYVCGVCNGRGAGGLVYACPELACAGWCSHLHCVLPRSREMTKQTKMLLHPTAVTSMYTLPAHRESSEAFGQRATLAMDGCNGQVRAAVGTPARPGVLEKIFYPAGIDIIKGSAQCSPSQNPLDCMRSFMNVKRCKPTWTWATATHASTEMHAWIAADFRQTMKHCSPTDVNSFVLSFLHLEQTLSSCFTLKTMQSGWAKAGLIGLEFHVIMSHWIGWRMLSAEQVQGIKDLLPSFFHEMASEGVLSDSSMQAMQPFFDVDFHHYAVDRSTLTTSRQRAQLMTVFQRNQRQRQLDALCRDASMESDEDKRPANPDKDKNGLCICRCRGRHYQDDDASWAKHITYKKHRYMFKVYQPMIDASTGTGETSSVASQLTLPRRPVLFALRTSTNGLISSILCC
jgi:hypothetical protein